MALFIHTEENRLLFQSLWTLNLALCFIHQYKITGLHIQFAQIHSVPLVSMPMYGYESAAQYWVIISVYSDLKSSFSCCSCFSLESTLVTITGVFRALSRYKVLGHQKKKTYNNLNKIFIILLINLLNTLCCSVLCPVKTSGFLALWYLAQWIICLQSFAAPARYAA